MSNFQNAKLVLLDLFGLDKDALHIYVGLTVYLLTALIFRLPLRDMRPLAAVFLAAITGEVLDLFEDLTVAEEPLWSANWHDIWNTMFWPTIIFLLAKSKRLLPG